MPYIRSQNPWMTAADTTGDAVGTLTRLMITVPQLRQQAQLAQMQMAQQMQLMQLQQAEMAMMPYKQKLLEAQTGAQQAGASADMAKVMEALQTRDNAKGAGVAEFAKRMNKVPGYNMGRTTYLEDTPEHRDAIANALSAMAFAESAAMSPSSAVDMFKPNVDGMNPLGERMYNAPIKLGGTDRLVDPTSYKTLVEALPKAQTQGSGLDILGTHLPTGIVSPVVAAGVKDAMPNELPSAMTNIVAALQGFANMAGGTNQVQPVAQSAAPPSSEVVRMTKDGRKAVFDANTKQFLRYAE